MFINLFPHYLSVESMVMKPPKPVFLKTYGKHKKKLSAWILPDSRKQAFDSTLSTDGDQSVFEPSPTMKKR